MLAQEERIKSPGHGDCFFSGTREKDDTIRQNRIHGKGATMVRGERVETEIVNRGVVPGRKVIVQAESATVHIPHPRGTSGTPQIELIRDGDIIQAIEVTCGCGSKIRLRCLYETE